MTKEGRSNQTRPKLRRLGRRPWRGSGQVKKRLGGKGQMQQVQRKSRESFWGREAKLRNGVNVRKARN